MGINSCCFLNSVRTIALSAAVLAPGIATPASAQDRPGPALELIAGWAGFADDGIVSETVAGGSARWYVHPRISIGPEVIYIAGNNHSHLIATGNLYCDLIEPVNGRPGRIVPFVVAGGGVFQTREMFFSGPFTSSEGAFTIGGGVRAAAGDRFTIGLDGRIGWEAHLRVTGTIGIRLGQ